MAIETALLTTDVVMVNLFPYLAIRHQVDNVPTTVVNGRDKLVGPLAEAEYVRRVLGAAGPERQERAAPSGGPHHHPLPPAQGAHVDVPIEHAGGFQDEQRRVDLGGRHP